MIPKEEIELWTMDLLRAHGVKVERWNNGEMGLLNVPAKWCAVLGDMTNALVIVGEGKPLPKLLKRGKGRSL